TGEATYSYVKPYTFIEESGERLCSNLDCGDGHGALVLGEETHLDGEYWVCGCPKNYMDMQIEDWSNTFKGDDAHDGLEYGNYAFVWRVRKIREY
ncbi:MAG: hypothetical protein QXF14_03500, partial [Candidatus Woesearchaeota archaeon]